MNYYLDIRNINLAWSAIAVTMTILMLFMQGTRKTYAGFGHWTLATVAASLGLILVSLRGYIPLAISMVVGNLLLLLQVVFIHRGMAIFVGRKPGIWSDTLIMLTYLAAYCWLAYVLPSTRGRIAIYSLCYSYYLLLCLRLALSQAPALLGSRNWLLIAPVACLALLYLARTAITVFWGWGSADVLVANPMNILVNMLTFPLAVLSLAGLIFLNIQRLELDLTTARRELNVLEGLLPMCANCKRIRDDSGYWHQVEQYISAHSQAEFTHGICPQCLQELYPEVAGQVLARTGPAAGASPKDQD